MGDVRFFGLNDHIDGDIDSLNGYVEMSCKCTWREVRWLATYRYLLITAIFEKFPVEEVFIRVRKEVPVLDGIVESVGVELTRNRSDR